jgi:hypothetical protein
VVSEPLDANGTPYQALPFTAAEKAYNNSTNDPNDRIALWFGGLVPKPMAAASPFTENFM